ncbi:hypothetical protein FQN54_009021 [Arachnomyces sp. PD_36]|nr:hypothetical protein FQN54_009021 [Arachnomyces sp. PD_36]
MVRAVPEAYASSDLTYLNLTRLLSRLEQNILSSSADLKALQQSSFHRTRVGTNVEYARTLLLQLERTIPGIKIPSRKQSLQTDLARKRQAVKVLKERLNEISAEAEARARLEEGGGEDEDEGGEDILGVRDREKGVGVDGLGAGEKPLHDTEYPHTTTAGPEGDASSHTLRHRHRPSSSLPHATTTTTPTPTATTTSSSHLPTTITTPPSPPRDPTESTLTTHRHEQETLTTSLLSLATQLKTSSQTFQSSLESEKSVLARAVEGLDKNTAGMEAAGKRMGMLRRMTEGRGWWGRMLVYVWIFGLWVVAVGIVVLGPKLRF